MNTENKSLENENEPSCLGAVSSSFSLNDRVVWDSHFGYEIGYFLGEGWVYNTYLIDIRTGRIAEECCHSKQEIHKYTNELIYELTKKYGYEKRFIDVF